MRKPVASLAETDLAQSPVWEYFEDEKGKVVAQPVSVIPVDSLQSRVVACKVRFRNGQEHWATISNIDLQNQRATSQFLLLSVVEEGQWFHLARYFDADYDERGPAGLARFLKLPVQEVFPISYDFGGLVACASIRTSGLIREEPDERLSRAELIRLSISSLGAND
jgi:hypothetical protein